MTVKGKSPSESAVEQNVYKIFPNDLNSEYTVFGGLVMGLCDRTALIVAERHSGKSCVTAAENSFRGDARHVVSAYLTFVALDKKGSPKPVPAVLPETDVERRRYEAAGERRNARLELRGAKASKRK